MGESILENLRNIAALSKKQEEKLIDMLLRLKNLEDQDRKNFMKEAKEFVKEIINDWAAAASFSSLMRSNVLFFLAIFLIFLVMGTAIFQGSDYESGLVYVIHNYIDTNLEIIKLHIILCTAFMIPCAIYNRSFKRTRATVRNLLIKIVDGIFSVFFIYKLFKCLREREQKKEEKKKNKQLKKKK